MKRVSFLAALLLLFSVLTARAEIIASGFCGEDPNPDDDTVEYGENLSWTLTDDGVLTISGSGRMFDASYSNDKYTSPWYNQMDLIRTAVIGQGVTSIGVYAFCQCFSLTEVTIPSSVTEIGQSAFSSCSSLTEVTIPESVSEIGYRAFRGCDNLKTLNYNAADCKITIRIGIAEPIPDWHSITTLNIGNGVKSVPDYAFYGCDGLMELTIPEGVSEIGYRAFYGCDNLKTLNYNAADCKTVPGSGYNKDDNSAGWTAIATLNIGDGVKSLPDSAFYGCTGLTELTIGKGVAEIGYMAFYDCDNLKALNYNAADCKITMSGSYYSPYPDWRSIATLNIGSTVRVIPDRAFASCTSLAEATIAEGVTSIGASAFYGCSSLSKIVIPESVTQMGSRAFSGCTSLARAVISDGVAAIGSGAFYGCTALASVSIPESVTAIPDSAFYGCTSLDGVILPGSTTSIGTQAFSGCSALSEIVIPEGVTQMGIGAFSGCKSLASVSIPESVTVIPAGTFQACSSLDGVIIPQSVTNIGASAFSGCRSLSEIVIPASVTEIGGSAFSGCSALTEATIPDGVETIGANAFYGCSSLPSITVPESVTSIGSEAFRGCSAIVSVLIPEGITIEGSPFSVQYPAGYPYEDEYKRYPLLESLIIRSDIDFDGQILDFAASPLLRRLEVPASVFNDGRDDVGFTQLPIDSAIVSLGTIDYRGFEFLNLCRSTLRYINLSKAENTELPDEALAECYRADSIALPANLERVGYAAFRGCMALKSIDIPASVTEIDDNAFEDCRSITAINFGGTEDTQAQAGRTAAPAAQSELRRIGNWAFYNCHQLQHLVIPEGVTEIGDAAFYGCTYLEDLELPSTVTRIGDNCFALCSKLKQIRVRAAVPPEIEAKTFFDVNREIPVYVPEDYLDDYREDPYWREFNLIGEDHGSTVGTDHTAISGLYRMEDGRIVLTEEMPVSVYTVTGALIYSGTATEVPLPVPGVYLLRIGGETVKVVRS